MYNYTVYVPDVDKVGFDHLTRMRAFLAGAGFDGWTETRGTGVWQGERESVTLFSILDEREPYVDQPRGGRGRAARWGLLEELKILARAAMPDQDAVLVTAQELQAQFG